MGRKQEKLENGEETSRGFKNGLWRRINNRMKKRKFMRRKFRGGGRFRKRKRRNFRRRKIGPN